MTTPADTGKVTITVEGERFQRVAIWNDDEAEALAQCIWLLAESSPSEQVAAIAEAAHRVMRGDSHDRRPA